MRYPALKLSLAITAGIALTSTLWGCSQSSGVKQAPQYYVRTNLTSDQSGYVDGAGLASHTDPTLLNPWAITSSPSGPFWIAENGYGHVAVFNPDGSSSPSTYNYLVPAPTGSTKASTPTGVTYNGTADFNITSAGSTATSPALYILCTQDGTISGWNEAQSGGSAVLTVDRSASGASYTAIALASTNTNGAVSNFLFAANFAGGVIDIFDKSFNYVRSFTDTSLPAGYAPYNVVNIGNRLVVAFAKQDSTKKKPVVGVGNGYVDIFDTTGHLQQHLISGGLLNAPWGMALAPSVSFGKYTGRLLVGNYGDGHINAYAFDSGSYQGTLLDGNTSNPITVPGLRALSFGNGSSSSALYLYLTADLSNGQDGLLSLIAYTTLH